MSLQYIIDGYNITNHKSFNLARSKRLDAAAVLLELILSKSLCGSRRNRATVVFDGFPPSNFRNEYSNTVEVMFSERESADALIMRIIERSHNPKSILLVSDDKELTTFGRAYGTGLLSVEDFLSKALRPKVSDKELLKPELNYSQIDRINRELKQLWLKE